MATTFVSSVNAPFYVACTDPLSECELNLYPVNGGVAGVCNTTSLLCECPRGKHGEDLLGNWNDCHIDSKVVFGIEAAVLAVCVLVVLSSIAGLIKLLFDWGVLHFNDHEEENPANKNLPLKTGRKKTMDGLGEDSPSATPKTPVLSPGSPDLSVSTIGEQPPGHSAKRRPSTLPTFSPSSLMPPPANAPSASYTRMVTDRRRRRQVVLILWHHFLFGASGVVFLTTRLTMRPRLDQSNYALLIAFAVGINSVIISLWLQAFTWFSNLPSLRLFAKMFPEVKDSMLIRYPSVVKVSAMVSCTVAVLLTGAIIIVAPAVRPDLVVTTLIPIGLTAFSVLVVAYMFVMLLVCSLLLRLFVTFQKSQESKMVVPSSPTIGSPRRTLEGGTKSPPLITQPNTTLTREARDAAQMKSFQAAVLTVRAVRALHLIIGPTVVILVFLMAWVRIFQANYYMCVSLLYLGGTLYIFISIYIFVMRMGRGAKDSARPSSIAPPPRRSSLGGV